jgi:predicted  nucleic acid-binding Zn-ribbon protein
VKDNNTYVKTYFRIESGYVWGVGHDPERNRQFRQEVKQILSTLGFVFDEAEEQRFHGCPECFRGFENLYCHPQSLSGYVSTESIPAIEEALRSAKSFHVYCIDTYEEIKNYTEEEFQQALEEKRDEITARLLQACTTKRSNLYVVGSFLLDFGSGVKTHDRFRNPLKGIEAEYINSLFQFLVDSGKIATCQTRSGMGYRTVKDTSKRKAKAV